MEKIQVLLSTYNGEKYLREQLDSIFLQKDVEVRLLVRDDGSTDSTVSILKEYQNRNIEIIAEQNIGVKKSFFKLLMEADESYKYFSFADQDDIWDSDKLITAIQSIKKREEQNELKPIIYASSVKLYDGDQVFGTAYVNDIEMIFEKFLIKNYYPGCTMVFNNNLLKIISMHDNSRLGEYPLHDHSLNIICTGCGGEIVYDKVPHMLYRQHGNNVIGSNRKLFVRIKECGLFDSDRLRSRVVSDVLDIYENCLDEEKKNLMNTILSSRYKMTSRIKLLFNKKLKPESFIEKVVISLVIMFGKF